jgi:carboxypeptidase C (cathepsin A)
MQASKRDGVDKHSRAFRHRVFAALTCLALGVAGAHAQQPKNTNTNSHSLQLPDRVLNFRMIAETIPVRDADGRIDAEAGVVAFLRDGQSEARPITFVIGGGPGTASAYLNLGALGPWRIPFELSGVRQPTPNPDSWLDFTDLVFLDPPGTGHGRLVANDAKAKERVWSVDGDVTLLSDAIAAWLRKYDRVSSPKSLVAQSYGGLRAPRIAESLHRKHGLSFRSLILVSPILDYGWRYHARSSPLSYATLLPSFAAARMEREGKVDASALAGVERYARGQFMEDYLRGLRDKDALKSLVTRVTEITGLSSDVVQAARGRIDERIFAREFARRYGKVVSFYDPAVSGDDPEPATPRPDSADPFLSAMKVPLTEAMTQLLKGQGKSLPYNIGNETVFESWRWNSDHGLPESAMALRRLLAIDPQLRVLIAHGTSDLATPYFESRLILDQFPDFGADRVMLKLYPGGHMFYGRDGSRAALRRDVLPLYVDTTGRP